MKNSTQIVIAGLIAFSIGYLAGRPEIAPQAKELAKDPKPEPTTVAAPPTDKKDNSAQLHNLNRELDKARKEIDKLTTKNLNLSKQIELLNLPVSSDLKYPELVAKLDEVPLPFLTEQLNKIFNDNAMQAIDDQRGFAKRLVDVALNEEEELEHPQISFTFSTSPLAGIRLLTDPASAGKFQTVFGHITASEPLNEYVIIKWRNMDTGEILSLGNQSLNTNGREQYVRLRPKKGWQPGHYEVSLYSMDNQVSPFGSGRFTLAHVNDTSRETARNQIKQDLIDSGQVMSKTVH